MTAPAAGQYLPLGCIHVPQAGSGLSHEQFIALASNEGWLHLHACRNQGRSSQPASVSEDSSSQVQRSLMRSPALKLLNGLLQANWIRLEVSADIAHAGLIVRVYVLPDDVGRRVVYREDTKLRNALRYLLQRTLDFSKDLWLGTYPTEGIPRVSYPARVDASEKVEGNSQSLLTLFNNIQPPEPKPEAILDPDIQDAQESLLESNILGLTSTLYTYQRRSAAVMLEKENSLGRSVDPRLVTVIDQHGNTWYYDEAAGTILKEPRYYDGVSGGILAEEMGSGKTIICLSLILATRHLYPFTPELYRGGSKPVRKTVGSLMDMAASTITRNSVPWMYYFGSIPALNGLDFPRCIEAIERNPGYYLCPDEEPVPYRVTLRGRRNSPSWTPSPNVSKIYLSTATIVIVPSNLVRQWLQEIRKHTTGLRVLTLESTKSDIPDQAELLTYDIILFAQSCLEALQTHVSSTSLANIHFKRCIVDEGHRLGNSKIRNKSNLLLVIESLRFSSRWIVTGTPAQGLIGVNDQDSTNDATSMPAHAYISSKQETKDLERIGAMAALYLKTRPWANSAAESGDTPADWAVYVMQPHHSAKSRGLSDCLRQTLNSLIVRHRITEVGNLLPPVEERVVVLDGSYQDRLSLNIFSMMIVLNSVQSQRTDRDYFFHPKQRKALMELVHNLRQSSFFGGSFYTASELRKSITTAEEFLAEKKVAIGKEDETLLREAIAFGYVAVRNDIRNLSNQFHEIPVQVSGFPGSAGEAWSLDIQGGDLVLTDASMVSALQRVIRKSLDDPTALNALLNGGLIEEGRIQRSKALEVESAQPVTARSESARTTVLAGNTKLGDSRSPRKNRTSSSVPTLEGLGDGRPDKDEAAGAVENREIPPSLAKTRLVATSSAKMSYLLDSIARYQEEEQIIVFYDNENIAWYIAGMLDVVSDRGVSRYTGLLG